MSLNSVIPLGALRLQAQQRADLENSPNVSTSEWNQMLSLSYKALWDKLIAAYGNDYLVADPYQFYINSTMLYDLPQDMYKLLGVDLQYSATPTGWVTLKRIEFIERNKWSWLNPSPISSNLAQLWYVPKPSALQIVSACVTTLGSTTVTVTDVTDLSDGDSVYGPGIADNTYIQSIDTTLKTIVITNAAEESSPTAILWFWNDGTTLDGIAGWEEFIIIDAAIKANIKQEQPIAELIAMRKEITERIEGMAEGRDLGQAHHSSDVISVNSPIISLGASNIRYRLLGNKIQFVPSGYDLDGYGGGGSYGGMF